MARYSTKQRKILLDFLSAHADAGFSASQIREAIADGSISISAIYRNLAALESEGKIIRIQRAGSREVSYRYADADECAGCIHLSCKKCGKMIHMNHSGAEALIRNVKKQDSFYLDQTETVLIGLCAACQKQ